MNRPIADRSSQTRARSATVPALPQSGTLYLLFTSPGSGTVPVPSGTPKPPRTVKSLRNPLHSRFSRQNVATHAKPPAPHKHTQSTKKHTRSTLVPFVPFVPLCEICPQKPPPFPQFPNISVPRISGKPTAARPTRQ